LKVACFWFKTEEDFRYCFLVFCWEVRGGLRLHFWPLSNGFIGKWKNFFYWSFCIKTERKRGGLRERAWWFLVIVWWPMHAIYNNLDWLRSSQQLGVSMARFKTPQLEKIVIKSPISSRIGFSYLWVIITRYPRRSSWYWTKLG
jgi:hypothetical protein